MSLFRYLNPVFIYQRRQLIRPYAQNYTQDAQRFAVRQIRTLRGMLAEHGLGLTANDRRLAALKNIHLGRRAFIVGNGPSLTIPDLERMAGEITFSCNWVFKAFGDTRWRPTYYATVETQYTEQFDAIAQMKDTLAFLPDSAMDLKLPLSNVIYFPYLHHYYYPGKPEFCTNPFLGIRWGATITYCLLQLAYYMGIREVYLVGVDFDFWTPPGKKLEPNEPYVIDRVTPEHFHPDYYRIGIVMRYPDVAAMALAYEKAAVAYAEKGARILNATRGGKLEVFPRVNLDKVLG